MTASRKQADRMTTKLVGEPIQRVEDPRLLAGHGRYLDDLGHDAAEVAVLRSPHAHAQITDIDVSAALDVPGLLAIYTYEDLTGPLAEPLPLLIPHPALTHGRTQYALARDEVNYVGEAIVAGGGREPVPGRGRGAADRGRLPAAARGGRGGRGPGGRAPGASGRARQRRGEPGAGGRATRRPRIAAAPHRLHAGAGRRAVGLHAAGGPGGAGPLGRRRGPAAGVDLHPDLDRGAGRGGRPSSAWISARSR